MQEKTRNSPDRRLLNLGRRATIRVLLFSLVWFVLTGSDAASWIVGGPAVLLAAGLSLLLAPASCWPLSLAGAWRFIPFFLRQSTLGGVDVMRRALSPRPLVNPGLVSYATFLPEDKLLVHTIDKDLPIWMNIQNLEWRIAALFRVQPAGEAEP